MEDECPICLEVFGDHVCVCPTCSKRFCFDCINRYTATRLVLFDDVPCPMCGKIEQFKESTIIKESKPKNIFLLLFLCCNSIVNGLS